MQKFGKDEGFILRYCEKLVRLRYFNIFWKGEIEDTHELNNSCIFPNFFRYKQNFIKLREMHQNDQ